MKSWTPPTAEQLQKVAALGLRPEGRAYFFDRLDNPLWVAPLAEGGFFADPPGPEPAGEPGYVRFPPWPEGRYLARVAPSAPDDVLAVIQAQARVDNPVVTRQLLEVALTLPDDGFRTVAPQMIDWLGGSSVEFFADEAASAIVRLLQIGETTAGLEAAAVLFAIQSDPRLAEKAASSDSPWRPRPEASSRLSEWEYDRLLDQIVGPLTEHGGMEGLTLLATLLDDALRASRWEDEATDDYSYVWRPAIEDHEQNSDTGIRDTLVSALRDVATRLASHGEAELLSVIEELRTHSLVHWRVALHALAESRFASSMVDELVESQDLLEDFRVKHEFTRLLQLRFSEVGDEPRSRLLERIRQGPNLEEYRERRAEFDGAPASDDEVERYARIWRRDWLSFLADHLADSDADLYRELTAEFGAPEHPGFLSWSSSWTGPESPVSRADLVERKFEEVVEFLRTWEPDSISGVFGPSIEGLGRVLAEVVTERAPEFASQADSLIDLDPTYVRSLFAGLQRALRDGLAFEWEPTLALASFVADQPFEPDVEVPDRDRDPGWRWCRREIGSLLQSGFSTTEGRIPFDLRNIAWSVLLRLTSDPNPSSGHEQRYGGDNMDPLTLSLNTNRGTAMHAVVEYALWVRRELAAAGADVSLGLEAMPEVRELLDAHLDPAEDPSMAVRAVYGRWLPWLHLLDSAWVAEHLDHLFPRDPALSDFRDAVWDTYVTWCPPYDSVYQALLVEYRSAIARVSTPSGSGASRHGNTDAKLGEHLVTLYWRGVAEDTDLDEYFRRADDELASDLMEFVGRALRNTTGELEEAVCRRIQELWDRRLDVGELDPAAHRKEIRSFGLSFSSAKLDQQWALTELERSVALAGVPFPGHIVVEHLRMVALTDPGRAVKIIAEMLKDAENEWGHVTWADDAHAIVASAIGAADEAVRANCAVIIDYFVRRGELRFRDLLQQAPER
jgi:hypothetical protein